MEGKFNKFRSRNDLKNIWNSKKRQLAKDKHEVQDEVEAKIKDGAEYEVEIEDDSEYDEIEDDAAYEGDNEDNGEVPTPY